MSVSISAFQRLLAADEEASQAIMQEINVLVSFQLHVYLD